MFNEVFDIYLLGEGEWEEEREEGGEVREGREWMERFMGGYFYKLFKDIGSDRNRIIDWNI